MATKTILILGAGVMQIPGIRLAKRNGWRVCVADADAQAPGLCFADEFLNVDLKDEDSMARAAAELRHKHGLDGVFTAGTDFSATVAWVARKLGLPGVDYQVALAATDKARMRARFQDCGVPCPRFVELAASDLQQLPKGMQLPVVVKPVDNMGARGVCRVDLPRQLAGAIQAALHCSRSGRVVVEEYVEGPELSLDAIVHQGQASVCGVADRHICFPPYFVEMGHTMPSELGQDTVARVERVFKDGIHALGIRDGAAKGDIKLTPAGPQVLEIAARLSGGYMSGWTFPYSSGVEVTRAALNVAVGLDPGDLRPKWQAVSAERAFISIPGTIAEICGVQTARNIDAVMDVFLRTQPGDAVIFPTNNVQKCGNVITKATTRDLAVQAAEQALASVLLRLAPDNPKTEAFLFSDDCERQTPLAFQLGVEQNRAAVVDLPAYVCINDPAAVAEGNFCISTLPQLEQETCCDWHGTRIQDALAKVAQVTGIRLAPRTDAKQAVLGRLFWQAFLKGGVQGAVYIIDTISAAARRGATLVRFCQKHA